MMDTRKINNALLDPDYGTEGITYPHTAVTSISALVETQAGILCVGSANTEIGISYCLMRLDSSGKLDTQFGSAGITFGQFEPGCESSGLGLHVCSDGRIIIIGHTYLPSSVLAYQALARFTADGKLDLGFQNSGHLVITAPEAAEAEEVDSSVTPSQIGPAEEGVLMLHRYPFAHSVIMKFDIDGNLDKRFNGVGYKHLQAPGTTSTQMAQFLTHGHRIYISGYSSLREKDRACLICLTDTGEEDRSFNGTGHVFSNASEKIFGKMAILDDAGNIVCVTQHEPILQGPVKLMAYTPAGKPLEGFSTPKIAFGGGGGQWFGIEVDQATQRIVTCGSSYGGDDADVVVGRFELDGQLDESFGEHRGWGRIALGKSIEMGLGLILQADAKALISGSDLEPPSEGTPTRGFVLRCLTNL